MPPRFHVSRRLRHRRGQLRFFRLDLLARPVLARRGQVVRPVGLRRLHGVQISGLSRKAPKPPPVPVVSKFAVDECRRNLAAKLPSATGDFERLVGRALSIVDTPARQGLLPHTDRADWKDLPHLVAALEQDCAYLTTYNVDDYEPGHPEIEVFRPGGLVRRVRRRLSSL